MVEKRYLYRRMRIQVNGCEMTNAENLKSCLTVCTSYDGVLYKVHAGQLLQEVKNY